MTTLSDPRPAPEAPPREVPCPNCEGQGSVLSIVTSSLDPGAQREFRQRCPVCHGVGKVPAEE